MNRIGKRNGPAEVPAPAPSANTGAARGGNDRRNQGTGNERGKFTKKINSQSLHVDCSMLM